MSAQDNPNKNYPTVSRALGRLIDTITDVWFDDKSEQLPRLARALCAFFGSATCFVFETKKILDGFVDTFLSVNFLGTIDTKVDTAFDFLLLPIFLLLSIFFAFMVTYGGRKSGPVRSYLAAFLLPIFVMWTLDRVVFS
ncbi:MAG: hypothetical protein OXI60_01145 [Acidiferrobacterales bacterium]|nr:hypothetical protein [Acidiferrobacterales bacterium]